MIKILRYSPTNESTLGLLFINDSWFCYTLENGLMQKYIPDGIYDLIINYDVTPLTEKYRKKFTWFENHIEISNVLGINNAYLHIGNKESDTDACVLLGNSVNNNTCDYGFLGNSTPAFELFYFKIFPLLKGGEKIQIEFKSI